MYRVLRVQVFVEPIVFRVMKPSKNIPREVRMKFIQKLLVVPKKVDATGNNKYRVVIDFRKLNNLTIGDAIPMPDINTILDQLEKAKYITCLDMASGYHQIPINPQDKEKTAFSTDKGHYEFNCMCFGLKGAPATFQRLMNRVLQGINGYKAFVYLDDIIGISPTIDEHIKNNFLGLAVYYRKFIQDFSKNVKPLNNLLKQNQPYIWSDSCQNAFNFF